MKKLTSILILSVTLGLTNNAMAAMTFTLKSVTDKTPCGYILISNKTKQVYIPAGSKAIVGQTLIQSNKLTLMPNPFAQCTMPLEEQKPYQIIKVDQGNYNVKLVVTGGTLGNYTAKFDMCNQNVSGCQGEHELLIDKKGNISCPTCVTAPT